jgi:hypothetical protein
MQDLFGNEVSDPGLKKSRQKRARDEVWDAIAEVCEDARPPLSDSDHKRLSSVVRSLRQKSATPEQIRAVAKHYKAKFRTAVLTGKALDAWFNEFRKATRAVLTAQETQTASKCPWCRTAGLEKRQTAAKGQPEWVCMPCWEGHYRQESVAKSRRSDPDTSREAASKIEASGEASNQRKRCLLAVNENPGQTAAEIAQATGMERHVPSRRLPELRDVGLVKNGESRQCAVTGNSSMTWFPRDSS